MMDLLRLPQLLVKVGKCTLIRSDNSKSTCLQVVRALGIVNTYKEISDAQKFYINGK
jgi:hypothetical protein